MLIFRSSRRVYPLFVYIFTGSGISCHVVSVDECRCIGCAIGHTHSSRQCETNRASSYSKIQTKAVQHLEPNARSRRLCVLSSPVERKRFNSLVQETYIGKKYRLTCPTHDTCTTGLFAGKVRDSSNTNQSTAGSKQQWLHLCDDWNGAVVK